MPIPISWTAIGDYIAPIALGGFGAFATFIVLLPSKLGERLVGHYFERRLASLRHEQSIELGKLQANLDHSKDRGTRSNEREYQATQSVWEKFVEGYRLSRINVIQFYQYPDLDRMPDDAITSFLTVNNVSDRSQMNILAASDKKRAFGNYLRTKNANDTGAALQGLRDTLQKQSVFIPQDLYKQFDAALTVLHGAWVEQSMRLELQAQIDQTNSRLLIGSEGLAMHDALRDAVRERLLRQA